MTLQWSLVIQDTSLGNKIFLSRFLCSKGLSYQVIKFIVRDDLLEFAITQHKQELDLLMDFSISVHNISHHFGPDYFIVNRSQYCQFEEFIRGKHWYVNRFTVMILNCCCNGLFNQDVGVSIWWCRSLGPVRRQWIVGIPHIAASN